MRTFYVVSILILLLISVMLYLFIPFKQVLSIEEGNTKNVQAYVERKHMEQLGDFDIHYIHSIHGSPVVESYQIQNNTIIQQRITYEEFAVGMPSNDDGEGTFIQQDGHYMITDMNRIFPYLDIRIAQVMPDHGLRIRGQFIPFEEIAKPGSWVRLTVRTISIWQKLKGVNLLER